MKDNDKASQLSFKDRRILALLNKAKDGDIEAFVQAYTFGIDAETFSINIENAKVNINGSVDPFSIDLKAIYDYDPDFYRNEMNLTEEDMIISEPSTVDATPNADSAIVAAIKIGLENVIGEVKSNFKKLDPLTGELGNINKKIDDVLMSLSELKSAPSKSSEDSLLYKKEMDILQKKVEQLLEENNALKKQLSAASNSKADAEKLKEENAKLYQFAYYDIKFKTKNNNALTETIKALKQGTSIAKVNICGQKEANEKYGLQKGDLRIKKVVEALTAKYSPDVIFRVNGDMFYVIPENEDVKTLYGNMTTLRDTLKSLDIRVAFDAQEYKGAKTLAEIDTNIANSKKTANTRTWAMDPVPDESEEDDGYREEDSLALLNSYRGN